jgi:hypothetical protein
MMMDRAAGVIRAAGSDELPCPACESADDGRDGEDGEPGQEDPLAGQQVGDASAEQQAAAGHHQVGGDDPLHVGPVQVQVASDGRQGGVDHGDVEDDENLGGEGQGQDDQRLARPVGFVVVGGCVAVVGGVGLGVRCGGGVGRERFGGGLGVHGNSLAVSVKLDWWSHRRGWVWRWWDLPSSERPGLAPVKWPGCA